MAPKIREIQYLMSTTSTPANKAPNTKAAKAMKPKKPIAPMQQRLLITWLIWIAYRLLVLPVLISLFNPTNPDIIGGIAWYGLWLIPAFIITPVIFKGSSPYTLLVSSMLTLVYLGASGVVLFTRVYGSSWTEIIVYGIDFALLLAVNVWLFILLKRLPSMNKVEKQY